MRHFLRILEINTTQDTFFTINHTRIRNLRDQVINAEIIDLRKMRCSGTDGTKLGFFFPATEFSASIKVK